MRPKPARKKRERKDFYVGTRFEPSTYLELAREAQATNDHNISGVVRAIVRLHYQRQRRARKGRYASPQARKP